MQDECIQQAAVTEDNPTLCDNITGAGFTGGVNPPKDKCYLRIANSTDNVSLCSSMAGGPGSYDPTECYYDIAVSTGNPALCAGLPEMTYNTGDNGQTLDKGDCIANAKASPNYNASAVSASPGTVNATNATTNASATSAAVVNPANNVAGAPVDLGIPYDLKQYCLQNPDSDTCKSLSANAAPIQNKVCNPECAATELCIDGQCVVKACSPACAADEKCDKGQCYTETGVPSLPAEWKGSIETWGTAYVVSQNREVEYSSDGKSWHPLMPDTQLPPGTHLKTSEDSSAVINFAQPGYGDAQIKIGPESEIIVGNDLRLKGNPATQLLMGTIWLNVKGMLKNSANIEEAKWNGHEFVACDPMYGGGVKGTIMVLSYDPVSNTSTVKNIEGNVTAFSMSATDNSSTDLTTGQMVVTNSDGSQLQTFDVVNETKYWDTLISIPASSAPASSNIFLWIGAAVVIVLLILGYLKFVKKEAIAGESNKDAKKLTDSIGKQKSKK